METQPKKASKSDIIVMSVLITLILGIGAYLLYSRFQKVPDNTPKQTPNSVLPKDMYVPDSNSPKIGADEVQVFFIDLENKTDNKAVIGCGDSLSAITRTYTKAGKTPEENIKAALGFLFEPKEQFVGKGGLYNSLYQSELAVDKITLDKDVASVFLTGTYMLGGECDSPRFEAQIKQTALQFPEVKSVLIFVNGTQLNLSLK